MLNYFVAGLICGLTVQYTATWIAYRIMKRKRDHDFFAELLDNQKEEQK